MKCVTCTAEIPPAFVHAIQINVCPGCAGPIMSDDSKKIMDELKDAMARMPNDPEGIAGWLLSTYDLFPKGTVAPTDFHRPRQNQPHSGGSPEGDTSRLVWANTPTGSSKFAERAGVNRLMADPKRAEVSQMIQNINSIEDKLYGGAAEAQEEEQEPTEEEKRFFHQKQMEELQQRAAIRGSKKTSAQDLLANNVSFANTDGPTPQMSSDEIDVLKNVFEGTNTNLSALDAVPELQKDRYKRVMAQNSVSGGGGNGLFRR